MADTPAQPFYSALKALGYIALVAIAAAMVYACVMALRYWPGIAV